MAFKYVLCQSWSLLLFAAFIALASCTEERADTGSDVANTAPANCLSLGAGSRLPRFGTDGDRLLLSFVISDTSRPDQLMVREWQQNAWLPAEEVVTGENWFVNWADFPSVKPMGTDLFYHYLSYSGEGTYDYDVRFGVGKGSSPEVLHNDGVPAEHGFVSSAHRPDGSLQVTWLDGRHTIQTGGPSTSGHDHGGGSGAMTLRTAVVDSDGVVSERRELDHRVCDCCSTATAIVGGRALVVYRDRSETEIRDMAFVREREDGSWSEPQPVNQDNWHIAGCPVNGPALAANESGDAATAWYTAADDRPRIMFARYDTVDSEFGPAIILDDDYPAGRVDVKVGKDGLAYVLGLGRSAEGDVGDLKLWSVKGTNEVSVRTVGAMSTARSSGFPRLAIDGDDVWVAYMTTDEPPLVQLCRVD